MSDTNKITVQFQRLPHLRDLPLPEYKTEESAGMDIHAAPEQPVILEPGQRKLIATGFKMSIPRGFEAQIRPRSGMAYKNGITILNSPGTIDSDYRGEVKLLAVNLSDVTFTINRGDRIAQMVISPVYQPEIIEVDELDETVRGEGGFGSTGSK